MPFMEKTISMNRAPLKMKPKSMARRVTIGKRAFLKMCLNRICLS